MQAEKKNNDSIRIRGARQNNLKNVNVDFEHGKLTVVTGVSGSGKSSLVFDTLYAEVQRRYVETFSPYVRQFMDRMDRPKIDSIEGVPPAIAIDQTNPVRTSRSTVGTMTELNDHLKMLFAQAAKLYCRGCGKEVREQSAQDIWEELSQRLESVSPDARLYVCFHMPVPPSLPVETALSGLEAQGFTRCTVVREDRDGALIEVVADRFKPNVTKSRAVEAIETAMRLGKNALEIKVQVLGAEEQIWKFTASLSCPDCGITYARPHDSTFSFNSPLGACETCRGFGRVIGVDYGLVIPDESKSLAEGAVKPWNTESYDECKQDLLRYARERSLDVEKPFRELTKEEKDWVLYGDPKWTSFRSKRWYGVKHFFEWLETKAYKMHVRVLLSRYRSYSDCPDCHGARLKPEALLWRLGTLENAKHARQSENGSYKRFRPNGTLFSEEVLENLPGLNIRDLMLLPIERLQTFFDELVLPRALQEGCEHLLEEIKTRLRFLNEVGLGYLNLDRQSRTLSGGEVQRINLTTALGTSLVNTLFVLDEPSIGLHPKDMDRVNSVMRRLRKAGNTLVVVEHDPQVMLAADRVIDMGPGPGAKGGKIVFDGTTQELKKSRTLTGSYLRGERPFPRSKHKRINPANPALVLLGAREHNLKNLDIRIPLHSIVCVAGVSGSGKSTLVQDVLVPALMKAKGKPTEAPGAFEKLIGADLITDISFVDQSPIGKTTRSTPAVFMGAFDTIRKLFAAAPTSRLRRYEPSMFSFNSGTGRCPSCSGSGFEHIEMQFLSDVYLSCAECGGTRYRREILEVKLKRKDKEASIADVLDMTVDQALDFFSENKEIVRTLTPLVKVGLNYLKLGQPIPTLSGGEAQRLKLAKHLADALKGESKNMLFVFDEPTTGLHFDDIFKLMTSLQELVQAGHSVLLVEHNLDVINASDWIIELGPEGGEKGGEELFAGTPRDFELKDTPTGLALAAYNRAIRDKHPSLFFTDFKPEPVAETTPPSSDAITIVNAREHNLKNLSLSIPRDKFTVVTGVSGSGKSTLAFDLVFNEGQRRYLESLNAFARSMVQPAGAPDVDAIYGIPPTVAIEQRTSRGGQKSTVATMTELYHFLRLLYVKLGVQYCPDCHVPVLPQSSGEIFSSLMSDFRGKKVEFIVPLIKNRKGLYKDLAQWARNKGFNELIVDGQRVRSSPFPKLDRFKDHTIELPVGKIEVTAENEADVKQLMDRSLELGDGVFETSDGSAVRTFSTKLSCPSCRKSFPALDPRLFSYNSKLGWCPTCMGNGFKPFQNAMSVDENTGELTADSMQELVECPDCRGTRLNAIARNVFFAGKSIADVNKMTIEEAEEYLKGIKLQGREASIARDALKEILSRLSFLKEVGLSYLTLDRAAPTLSGGEAQRIRLASQLGTNLQGVCYVLDEPTIGLHPRDNQILLSALSKLTSKGNSLLVVEHDVDTIRAADHVIDIGPGAGVRGGKLIAQGTVEDIENAPDSLTGRYLKNPLQHNGKSRRKTTKASPAILLKGVSAHNLTDVEASFPLNRLTVLTGVSGSGKSTLAREVLQTNLINAVHHKKEGGAPLEGCTELSGWESVDRVLEVDQTPIGKTPRSCPATYIGFWDDIRKLFAGTEEAKARGYTASRFSFNVKGGRCEACEGQGVITLEMNFLPNVKVHCDVCDSMRFNDETLEVKWKGKSIGEVLKMEVDEAVEFFASIPSIHHPLKLMQEVGLGYLTLGQQSSTLSGGEAQRIKLVTELTKVKDDVRKSGRKLPETVYILDEPTVGLHMADVDKLIKVLHRLVDAGNTVIVIEHNLDVIAEADWIIDMGPEGGSGGGTVVYSGTPGRMCRAKTHTAEALRKFLEETRPKSAR